MKEGVLESTPAENEARAFVQHIESLHRGFTITGRCEECYAG